MDLRSVFSTVFVFAILISVTIAHPKIRAQKVRNDFQTHVNFECSLKLEVVNFDTIFDF